MSRHRRKNRTNNQNLSMDNRSKELVELWILKMVLNLNAHREFFSDIHGSAISYEDVAYFLNLDRFIESDDTIDKREILQIMRQHLEILESKDKFRLPKENGSGNNDNSHSNILTKITKIAIMTIKESSCKQLPHQK